MVGKLQKKFILAATGAIFIILIAVMLMVNGYSYVRVRSQINAILDLIAEYGYLPNVLNDEDTDEAGSASSSEDRNPLERFELNQESYYQIRYYIAKYDANGELLTLDIDHIAALDETQAQQLAEQFIDMTAQESFLFDRTKGQTEYNGSTYAYKYETLRSGSSMLVVMDVTSYMHEFWSFLRACFWFGVLCIGIFVALVSAFSKRILRPMIQNMRDQKTFITNAGHELKTPVAIISANAEVLEMVNGQSEWTDSILQQSRRLSLLINNLITLSRMSEKGSGEIQLTDVNLSAVTLENAQAYRTLIEQQNKKYEINIQPDVHAVIEENTYGELVNILLDNAAKYCDEGGCVRIVLSREASKKGVRLAVSNSYKDGKDVDYSRFFQRFYRGDTSHNSRKAGFGIGLSMAEQIVNLSKGKIRVGWKDGMITFTVTFR